MTRFSPKKRVAVAAALLIGAIVVLVMGAGSTGAYFQEGKQGDIAGTIGSIHITGSGGGGANGLDLAFDGLMPGEPQTVTANYTNTGSKSQDVWLVFNDADALHALNDLGTYGEVHILSNGTEVFVSKNLNDDTNGHCGPLSPSGCWPVPKMVKLADNVAPTAGGTFSFTFGYASKLSTQPPAGSKWNSYPLGAPTKSGLPYQVVATQVGHQP